MISKNEAKIDRIVSQLENQWKQIKKIEMPMIPMLEHEIASVEGGIGGGDWYQLDLNLWKKTVACW
jgi:hypothetical protein